MDIELNQLLADCAHNYFMDIDDLEDYEISVKDIRVVLDDIKKNNPELYLSLDKFDSDDINEAIHNELKKDFELWLNKNRERE